MSLIRNWFIYKNQFKPNVKSSFEKDVRKNQADIKTDSLVEFFKTHKALLIIIAMIVIISVLAVPLIYVGISGSSAWSNLFLGFILFILGVIFLWWI